jgi:putative membrane protein
MEYLLYIKSLHLIFIVTWFAGLFYIVRLFIYHTEADVKPEPEKSILQKQYKIMSKRLWYGITWPSMILTIIFGGSLLWLQPYYLSQGYFILKLCFVGALILYQMQCHVIFKQLQRDEVKYSSLKLRIWNEVATVLLFAIVFLIVLKTNTGWVWGMLGLVIFSATLMLAIKIYKKSREKKGEKLEELEEKENNGPEQKEQEQFPTTLKK